MDDLQNYIVNTGADGRLSRSGVFQSSDTQLKQLVRQMIQYFKARPGEPRRVMFYVHGGLVSEEEAGEAIRAHYQTFLDNGVYPIFFIWESTILDALQDHLRDVIRERFEAVTPGRIVDELVDEMVEEAARLFPEPWEQMKRRGEQVFSARGGGWRFFRLLLKALRKEQMQIELHLVGHSAGSIVLASFLQQLLVYKEAVYPYVKIFTCTLYAPACTVDLFDTVYARAMDKFLVKRCFLFTLDDELERADTSVPLYHKSILYLVSQGFEGQNGFSPILGMEIYARYSKSLVRILSSGRGAWFLSAKEVQPIIYGGGAVPIELISRCQQHGGFSYDPDTLNSTLRIMLNSDRLKREFA